MRLFELLKTNQKEKRLSDSEEYQFFIAQRHLLIDYNVFLDLYNLEDSFSLVKANIIIRSILNKKAIEERLDKYGRDAIVTHGRIHHHDVRIKMLNEKIDLPSFKENEIDIFVPIFNRAMNYFYAKEPDKLFDYPYDKLIKDFSSSITNPFETYNFSLFDSNFTTLIKLGRDRTSMAFYHLDYRELLFINQQGGLDVKICLFDRFMDQPDHERIIDRLIPVVNAYFDNNRDELVTQLLKQELISKYIVEKWQKSHAHDERRKYRL